MVTSLRGIFPRALEDPPKGIQRKLLEKIRTCMRNNREALSASAVGETIGISRSTARRYLEYLLETGEATFEYDISSVGRPVKLYRLL
jgi:response regulator of citrate/malate metabolism